MPEGLAGTHRWRPRKERRGVRACARPREFPLPTACGLAEQGIYAVRTHPMGPEIPRIGTSHERSCGYREVQGQQYYKYYRFTVCKTF